jgi:hypothetical protein
MRDTGSLRRNVAVPVTEDRLRYVIAHLRERDRTEIYALRWDDNEEYLLHTLLPQCGASCWIWERDGVPVSIQGVIPLRPNVWSMFAFGTDEWPKVVLDMTRHAERVIKPALRRAKVRRVECRALASHTDSLKWLGLLGAHIEGFHELYGRDGELFVTCVWFPQGDPHANGA